MVGHTNRARAAAAKVYEKSLLIQSQNEQQQQKNEVTYIANLEHHLWHDTGAIG
jgi:hypothetical protein